MTEGTRKLWEIKHLDLSLPLPSLYIGESIRGICAFIWWKDIPLGHTEIDTQFLPMTAGQLIHHLLPKITPVVGCYLLKTGFDAALPDVHKKLQRKKSPDFSELLSVCSPLLRLENTLHLSHEQAVSDRCETISIVICTRDRPDSLARCLLSLQRLETSAYELIVVDNAPSSDVTEELVAKFHGAQYVREPRPGLSVARNRGLQVSTGELIAFTDDDVEVHPQWLERLRITFRNPAVMAMTGLILPARLDTKAEEAFQRGASGFGWGYRPITFDSFFFERTKSYGAPVWCIGAGANMAFRREIFDKLGGFDERLGAGASGCSEDSEYWYRILANGWACQYNPLAVAYHHHRVDFNSLTLQMRSYMKGHVVALLVQAFRYKHWGNLRRLLVSLPYYYGKKLLLASLHGFRDQYRTLIPEIQGCLMAFPYYFVHSTSQPHALKNLGSLVENSEY